MSASDRLSTRTSASRASPTKTGSPKQKLFLQAKNAAKAQQKSLRALGIVSRLRNVDASQRFSTPPNPPTTEQLTIARQRAKERTARSGGIDMALGQETVSLLDTVQVYVPGALTYVDDALRKCFSRLGLTHYPAYSLHDIDRYADPEGIGGSNDLKLPVVWMNDMNAPGIDATRPGTHGFGWMFGVDCSFLDLTGPFHLLNAPGREDQWKQRTWRYCGKYYAHRTGCKMSRDGWRRLPQATRDAAASIRAGHPDKSVRSVQEAHAMFETGQLRAELVVFQFCGMPGYQFLDRLKEGTALAVRPAKPPSTPPPKLGRERIFAKHPDCIQDYMQIQQRMSSRHPG